MRNGRLAGAAALFAVACAFAALATALSGTTVGQGGSRRRALLDFHAHEGTQLLATGLRVLSLLATAYVAVYLGREVLRRLPDTSPWLVRLGLMGPLAVAIAAAANHFGLLDAARDFAAHGPRTEGRAAELADQTGTQRVVAAGTVLAAILFSAWGAWLALAAHRAALTSRFLSWYGAGAAVAAALLPVAGQGLFLGWLGSVGLILLGGWPKGSDRPDLVGHGE